MVLVAGNVAWWEICLIKVRCQDMSKWGGSLPVRCVGSRHGQAPQFFQYHHLNLPDIHPCVCHKAFCLIQMCENSSFLFFFFKAWGCSKCVVGLWPAAAGLDHFFSIQLKHWHTVLWNILDLCLLFQVIYLQKAELNRETVYPMHPSSIHGVEDMSTLAELHEAAIMHNLFLRYQKDNIYVRHCLNLQAHLPPWWTWNLWVLCVLQGCKGGISQTIHNINGKPLLML